MAKVSNEGWINIYPPKGGSKKWCSDVHNTKEEAEEYRSSGCIATVKIEWEE